MAEVSFEFPMGLPDAAMFGFAGKKLKDIEDAAEREEAINTIFKLIDAVLADPPNLKKRRVKKQNATFHQKVGRHDGGIDFLRAAGFLDCDDPEVDGEEGVKAILCMDIAYISRLTDAHHALSQVAKEVGIQAPPLPGGGFNPFTATAQAVDSTRKTKAPNSWKSEAERVREEVRQKEKELKEVVEEAPEVPLKPSAFWLSTGRRLEEVVREAEAEGDVSATDSQLVLQQAASMRKGDGSGATKFANADKRRLAQLSKVRAHSTCILRIICPDKSVLQAHFRAADRGEHVIAQIRPLLAAHVRDLPWYIYQTPPMRRMMPRETLVAAGFAPGASLYLGFDGEKPSRPYLDTPFEEALGPMPEAPQGANAAAAAGFTGEAMGWGRGQRLGGPATDAS